MDTGFDTMQLPDAPGRRQHAGRVGRARTAAARPRLDGPPRAVGAAGLAGGGPAVRSTTIWYILAGQGRGCGGARRTASETVSLRPGACVCRSRGHAFPVPVRRRRCAGCAAVRRFRTMPPWPGDDEAHDVPGAWDAASMTEQATEPLARFVGVSLDCPDPAALADFYLELLGGQVLWRSADSAGIRVPGVVLAMYEWPDTARRPGPDPPWSTWISTAGQDVEAAAARAVAAGGGPGGTPTGPQVAGPAGHGRPLLLHHDRHPARRMTENSATPAKHPAQMLAFGGE